MGHPVPTGPAALHIQLSPAWATYRLCQVHHGQSHLWEQQKGPGDADGISFILTPAVQGSWLPALPAPSYIINHTNFCLQQQHQIKTTTTTKNPSSKSTELDNSPSFNEISWLQPLATQMSNLPRDLEKPLHHLELLSVLFLQQHSPPSTPPENRRKEHKE